MEEYLRISIVFDGRTAANGVINFYDAQMALAGFQRSLALATHLVLNGEIITQAPSLKGAEILALAPEEGSWKLTAVVTVSLASGIYTVGTASKETPIGHMISSVYDYALNRTMGIELDYDKTIRQLLEERDLEVASVPTPEQLNSLVEKSRRSVIEMHRPIEKGSATTADLKAHKGDRLVKIGPRLDHETARAARDVTESDDIRIFRGSISSFNMNTHTGRIYLPSERRTIPFEMAKEARIRPFERTISRSLDDNIAGLPDVEGNVELRGIYYLNRAGDLSKILVLSVDWVDAR